MIRTINDLGLAEIAAFLSANTSKTFCLEKDRLSLNAWARDAEYQMGKGNPPTIEISAVASIHGRTQAFEISTEGVDSEPFEATV